MSSLASVQGTSKRITTLRSPLLSPKLSSAPPPNRATRATIAFPESDRPDRPRAGDAFATHSALRAQSVTSVLSRRW